MGKKPMNHLILTEVLNYQCAMDEISHYRFPQFIHKQMTNIHSPVEYPGDKQTNKQANK